MNFLCMSSSLYVATLTKFMSLQRKINQQAKSKELKRIHIKLNQFVVVTFFLSIVKCDIHLIGKKAAKLKGMTDISRFSLTYSRVKEIYLMYTVNLVNQILLNAFDSLRHA